MTSPLEHDHPVTVLPDLIRVERGPSGAVRVLVDGEPLLLAISAADPISVDVDREALPGVRLTLLARSVEVSDRMYASDGE